MKTQKDREQKFYTKPFASFTAKKQLGQNFLVDPNIKRKIIAGCELKKEDVVLEIGAGLGALTEEIAGQVKHVFAIETDWQLLETLRSRIRASNITLINADFLSYPLDSLSGKIKVIGTLPYYITTPIIEKVLQHSHIFNSLYITVQYELAMRMLAKPNTKEFGSFSCFIQYFADVQKIVKIKSTAFRPIPKVDSCFIKLVIHPKPAIKVSDEKLFFFVIHQAFQQRRKNILNALNALEDKVTLAEIFNKINLKGSLRAENLSLEDFASITNQLKALRRNRAGG